MNADNNQVCINININFKVRKTNTLFQNDYVDRIEDFLYKVNIAHNMFII